MMETLYWVGLGFCIGVLVRPVKNMCIMLSYYYHGSSIDVLSRERRQMMCRED